MTLLKRVKVTDSASLHCIFVNISGHPRYLMPPRIQVIKPIELFIDSLHADACSITKTKQFSHHIASITVMPSY